MFDSIFCFQFEDGFHIYVNFWTCLTTISLFVLNLDEEAASLGELDMELKVSCIGLICLEINFLQWRHWFAFFLVDFLRQISY